MHGSSIQKGNKYREERRLHSPVPGSARHQISLRKDYDPGYKADYVSKKDAAKRLQEGIERLVEQQDKLYAQDTYALLIIFQAMDAAGKDSTIKHVMSGLNPQGCDVAVSRPLRPRNSITTTCGAVSSACPSEAASGSSIAPTTRRSWWSAFIPSSWKQQHLPPEVRDKGIWKRRFEEINNFEKYLVDNGIVILKFFLNVSKAEQKKRFLERIDHPEKNWKFSAADVKERALWDQYMDAFEDVFNHTSTEWAPWYIIPADRKWFARLAVAEIILSSLEKLQLSYPTLNEDRQQELLKAKDILENEE